MTKEFDVQYLMDGNGNVTVKNPSLSFDATDIDWEGFLKFFISLIDSACEYRRSLMKKESNADKEICDLLHYIELYDLSREEYIDAAEKIKDARLRRRDIKDEFYRTDIILKSFGTKEVVSKLKGCITEMKKLENRIYRPRLLADIFKNAKGRETDLESYRSRKTNNTKDHIKSLKNAVDSIDSEIEDILVQTEDANYNVVQGYNVFKELKKLRNERRKMTDEIALYESGS